MSILSRLNTTVRVLMHGLQPLQSKSQDVAFRPSKPSLGIPDEEYYHPLFSPWLGYGEFKCYYEYARSHTLVSADRCWILFQTALQAISVEGEYWECGVYKGGTALMLDRILAKRGENSMTHLLRLFDTFSGMPVTDVRLDCHRAGDFCDTSLSFVKNLFPDPQFVSFHPGMMPRTFEGLESKRIAFAHIDVDIYQSILACCEFIYPRLARGGIMVFDDYGHPTCPGARRAVDEFFMSCLEVPLILPTGQAIVSKL